MKLLLASVLCLVVLGVSTAQTQLKPPTEAAPVRVGVAVTDNSQGQGCQ